METNIGIKEKNKVKIKEPKNFRVVMHNDDFTTMEFVIAILMDIFNKDIKEANKIMLDVHKKGNGVAGIYPYDIAFSKVSKAMNLAREEGFPFKLTVEEE
ncbi:ATP-dependent Clp protease adaptor ClpS [Clostridium chauvoei]|uniref:ATP-dependent Clp protease adapter protein ClpS n=2 Tax=Clostridium chauvoei TaxID=46867 RepID=S6EYX7_9CLOT|nr:ATP-dependent Clp protease adaptor ClpS [Clostridium chauvoei]ATD54851.1 ATP-dependent Clp protease adaptor ClpS [Clostridium chauvoei]ATD57469.1 ATP-dependent Clp protease adaptor ClpS [Clostridium chauvoei]MBX7280538.1 ATP-dependent Clp protease adaptor ClpS [Clostridium chauvoei]MBX7283023.1 ATP-dependent Clp protease adaptor ClpS [Clostridium chauvoei]MBX7285540.1 ATP-dependent Clp protease adaptor ClpS [Clostridium chauvoei]